MTEPSLTDWISAVSAAVGALVVLVGLIIANFKINEAQRTARQLRRSEVAEELISLAYNVEDALNDIRNPFDSIPIEEIDSKGFTYQNRYERIAKYNELFKNLRDAQIRVRAVIGNEKVEKATDELFKARAKVGSALELLYWYATQDDGDDPAESRDHKRELRQDAYSSSFSGKDSIGESISQAVSTISSELNNVARLELRK